jgi:hypothetical protein
MANNLDPSEFGRIVISEIDKRITVRMRNNRQWSPWHSFSTDWNGNWIVPAPKIQTGVIGGEWTGDGHYGEVGIDCEKLKIYVVISQQVDHDVDKQIKRHVYSVAEDNCISKAANFINSFLGPLEVIEKEERILYAKHAKERKRRLRKANKSAKRSKGGRRR